MTGEDDKVCVQQLDFGSNNPGLAAFEAIVVVHTNDRIVGSKVHLNKRSGNRRVVHVRIVLC